MELPACFLLKENIPGKLDTINVDGTTDTPDFSVDVSGHKVDLTTQFHAIVNGTNGNTYLQPVKAHFLHTDITATGEVVRAQGQPGHDIHLDVTINKGRIEDLLELGVKTEPPVMTGNVQLKTKFYLPPGSQPVNQKLQLQWNIRGREHIVHQRQHPKEDGSAEPAQPRKGS